MTLFKHPLDHRASRDRIGRPYYGHALKRIMNAPDRVSFIERMCSKWNQSQYTMIVEIAFVGMLAVAVACSLLFLAWHLLRAWSAS